ncbi:MAG: DUF3316 domain-containing protein [Prevotella sp.]|nr:DUF3316 domain-containing protein [Prevotella sp.]
MATMTNSHRMIRRMALGLVMMTGLQASAQTDTIVKNKGWVERTSMFGLGHTDILDTYLSQETFAGTELRYVSQMLRQKDGSPVVREMTHQIFVSSTGTRGNNNSLLSAMYTFMLGWYYQPTLSTPHLRVAFGGLADGTLGGAYNTRNSNNPAQARLSLSVDPAVRLRWNFHVGRFPLTLRYAAAMPLVGLAFSPNYGQSYYEIFSQGNYDHNVVFTSPFMAPQLHQMVTVDFRLWRQTFTVGYLGDIRQMRANNLKYHQYTHGILLGWRY